MNTAYGKSALEFPADYDWSAVHEAAAAEAAQTPSTFQPGVGAVLPDNLLYPRGWSGGYVAGFVIAPVLGALLGATAKRPGVGALVGLGGLLTARLIFSTGQITKAAALESRVGKFFPL